MVDLSFYNGKTVLITGHTGFKGTWLSKILINAGAKVVGYSLKPSTNPNLFTLSKINKDMISIIGDVRDFKTLKKVFDKYKPSCVFHLAAQPLVLESYRDPKRTYETNVLGTVNILECVRLSKSVKSFLNVTTDKVYFNDEKPNHPFKEHEPLDGYDPYSNSKSCSELVTHSYTKSFLKNKCSISTARAGNVIGGGDFSKDRIIPDCVKYVKSNSKIIVRNPTYTRPYQHVLEPISVYLEIVEKQYSNRSLSGSYNIGPDSCDNVTTGKLVTLFCEAWGEKASWVKKAIDNPHEANFLQLDNSKIKKVFKWKPKWHINKCMEETVSWYKQYFKNRNSLPKFMDMQIKKYFKNSN